MPGEKSRQFGNIRKLPSGRYQARYRGPDGKLRSAPNTFERKSDAAKWLSFKEAEITKGEWIAPELARQPFREYSEQWMRDRVLKVRTAELYQGLLSNHLLPTFAALGMGDIDEGTVRRWRKERLEAGKTAKRPFGPVTVAKAYRLLHAIFTTAVEDDRIVSRNPCRIAGAGKEESEERKSSRCPSSSRSRTRFRSDTAPWCCWPRSPTCGGASWPGCGEGVSTWPRARSGSRKRSLSWTRAACYLRRQITGGQADGRVPRRARSRDPLAPGTVRRAG
jgi:Phage integrase, N-terminal SAM-like domain